ncbi:MAG: selenocysteine lyase [Acidobacteriaceae bacterium]|nr:selenocysteine lyase [Acidobacteriaceae bacterium]
MGLSRRGLMKAAGLAGVSAALGAGSRGLLAEPTPSTALPVIGQFAVREYEVCLNNARWHPMSHGAMRAVQAHVDYKARGIWTPPDAASQQQKAVKESFARLIHAVPEEIAYVNSTTAGENLIVAGLGLTGDRVPSGINIVTDALHFEGSLYLYGELKKRGIDVRVVKPKGWRVEFADLEKVIDKKTRLVSLSQVSYINGFEQDVKAVCDLAHAHGAYVYTDIVQAAGCVSVDVRATNVDFCASASYKWLMGDFGLGFLYIRRDLIERMQRTQWSFRQMSSYDYHAFPGDSAGEFPMSYTQRKDAAGLFEVGTYANGVIAALSYSLPWIEALGVANIQAHAQQLTARMKTELPRLGYASITPAESRSSIVAFEVKDGTATAAKLKRRKVDVSLSPGRMRISPSIYNTMADVDALLESLA